MFTRSRRFVQATLFAIMGLAACDDMPSAPEAAPREPEVQQQARRGAQVIPDRYVVVFKDGVHDAPGLARRLAAEHGGTVHHTYQHAIKGFAATLPAPAVEALRRNPNVADVEQDQIAEFDETTQSSAPWGLDRVDQRDLPLSTTYTYPRTGSGVTAYVIDSGIYTAHSEFGTRARLGFDALATDGYNAVDCTGHGTHVAGIVGGSLFGIAKSVKLVAVRVRGCNPAVSASTADMIKGVDWVYNDQAAHRTPAVVNFSLGVPGGNATLDAAVMRLVKLGVTVVASAGNNGIDACTRSPARVDEVLTVGATDQSDASATWTNSSGDARSSNYGACIDVYAPGKSIISAAPGGVIATATKSGTSMAAPHVAGAAALYLQANPMASPSMVGSAIVGRATTGHLTGLDPMSPDRLLYIPPASFTILPRDVNGSHSPSAVLVNGVTFVFYKGAGTDQGIYMTRNNGIPDGGTWRPIERLPTDVNTSDAPSAVAIGGTIYVVYKGAGSDVGVWMAQSSDLGVSWTTQLLSRHVNSNTRPQAVVYGNSLHVVYKGVLTDDRIFAVPTPSVGAPPFIVVPADVNTSASPSAILVNGSTFVFYKGVNGDPGIYMTRNYGAPNQETYEPMKRLPSAVNTSDAPSTIMIRDTIYVVYKGAGSDTRIWVVRSSDGGASWSITHMPDDVNTSTRPEAFVYGNSLYVVYKGAWSDQRMYAAPVTGEKGWSTI